MGESKLYKFHEFLMIVLGGLLALSGVWVIIKKPTYTTGSQTVKDDKSLSDGGITGINSGSVAPLSLDDLQTITCACEEDNIDIEKQVRGLNRKPLQDRVEIRSTAQIIRQIISVDYHESQKLKVS